MGPTAPPPTSLEKAHRLAVFLMQAVTEDFIYRFYFHTFTIITAFLGGCVKQCKCTATADATGFKKESILFIIQFIITLGIF